MKKLLSAFIFAAFVILLLGLWFSKPWKKPSWMGVHRVEKNYGREVDSLCQKSDIPSDYFKALIILETSANKPVKSRYERKVFEKLLAVKNGKDSIYSNLTTKELKIFSNKDLKALATSWGPLQVMGYHAIKMGKSVDYFSGNNSLKNSILWCVGNYGKYLKKKDFKNAFHIHNTGKPYPTMGFSKTYDPYYVDNGLTYIKMLKLKNDKKPMISSLVSIYAPKFP